MIRLRLSLFVGAFLALAFCLPPQAFADAPVDSQRVATSVSRLLQQGHYTRRKIDNATAREVLKAYIESLDYNHLFFTQKDIDEFTVKFGADFDRNLLRGDLSPAFDIFNRYKDRVAARVDEVKKLTAKEYSFDSDRKLVLNRQKEPWPRR